MFKKFKNLFSKLSKDKETKADKTENLSVFETVRCALCGSNQLTNGVCVHCVKREKFEVLEHEKNKKLQE